MKRKFLALLAAGSFAFMMQACGDDSSSSPTKFEDEEEVSSDSEDGDSSSSVKGSSSSSKKVSSSSAKEDGKSSSSTKGKSSSSAKDDGKSSSSAKGESSSSAKDDGKSSSSAKGDSSSSVKEDGKSSSSEVPESSSSEEPSSSEEVFELKSGYVLFNDPNYTSQVGELRWVENGKISESKLEFYQDSKVVRAGGKLFVLEGFGMDNVNLVDESSKKVSWQKAVSVGGNPSDIVADKKQNLWVSQQAVDVIYSMSMDGKLLDSIDVSDFASEGGTAANVVDLEVTGDTLVVLMQRYIVDGYSYTYPKGLIALFNIGNKTQQKASDALATIEVSTTNPSAIKVVNGVAYVATQADYNGGYGNDADGKRGIEKVDLAKKSSSLFVAGTKLGGGVISMDVDYAKGIVYAAVRGAVYGSASVVEVNLASGSVKTIDGLVDPEGGLTYDEKNGVLLIGDRGYGATFVYAYDGKHLHKIEYAAEVTFAPYSIAF